LIVWTFTLWGQASEADEYVIPDNNLFLSAKNIDNGDVRGFSFMDGSSILAKSPSTFRSEQVLAVRTEERNERERIISYQVEKGDSLNSIADRFDISVDTIKWANSITNGVNPGDDLLILPTTGVLYYVEKGDTLSHIAEKHKASGEDIIAFNDIEDETGIVPGDQLIIPDGEKPAEPVPQRAPTTTYTGFAAVTHGTVTQGDHPGHANAVDIANNCGTPIYSGSSGTVSRTGYGSWPAGNYIWIDYGNFEALYAHLQDIYVSSGETVSGGQQIGTMGNTGLSTGCHLHFETRGVSNPFSHMQRGMTMN